MRTILVIALIMIIAGEVLVIAASPRFRDPGIPPELRKRTVFHYDRHCKDIVINGEPRRQCGCVIFIPSTR